MFYRRKNVCCYIFKYQCVTNTSRSLLNFVFALIVFRSRTTDVSRLIASTSSTFAQRCSRDQSSVIILTYYDFQQFYIVHSGLRSCFIRYPRIHSRYCVSEAKVLPAINKYQLPFIGSILIICVK